MGFLTRFGDKPPPHRCNPPHVEDGYCGPDAEIGAIWECEWCWKLFVCEGHYFPQWADMSEVSLRTRRKAKKIQKKAHPERVGRIGSLSPQLLQWAARRRQEANGTDSAEVHQHVWERKPSTWCTLLVCLECGEVEIE